MDNCSWRFANDQDIFQVRDHQGVCFLSFKRLEETGRLVNGFSTRLGGASTGDFATMNFSYHRDDDPEHVLENFTRMAAALKVERDRMVVSWQTHTTNIRRVSAADAGKGVIYHRDFRDVDGLICNVPGITLVTFYADCVPLYFYDQKNHAIGLSHSGWRGTKDKMGQKTVAAMKEAFGTRPKDLLACIGPSICKDCFEVGADVIGEFGAAFAKADHPKLWRPNGREGKYQLDLWQANELILQAAGIPKEQITTTNVCTMCNPGYLFSHRREGAKRGNLAAFLALKEE